MDMVNSSRINSTAIRSNSTTSWTNLTTSWINQTARWTNLLPSWFNLTSSRANLTYEEQHMQCPPKGSLQLNNPEKINLGLTPVLALLCLWCLMSNSIVITAIVRYRSRVRPGLLILCSLTLTDLLWGGLFLPLYITHNIYEVIPHCTDFRTLLFVAVSVSMVCTLGTVGNVAILSVDRYLVVAKWMKYKYLMTCRRAIVACLSVWLLAIIIASISLSGFVRLNTAVVFMACYIVPCAIIIIVLQITTIRSLRKHNNTVAPLMDGNQQSNTINNVCVAFERKLTVTTNYVVVVLGLVYIPMALLRPILDQLDLISYTLPIFAVMGSLCPSLNPLLYCLGNEHIREEVRKLLRYL